MSLEVSTLETLRRAVMVQHARTIQTLIRNCANGDQIHSILTNTFGATFAAACDEDGCSVEIMGHAAGAPGGWSGAAAQWAQNVLAEHGDTADQSPLALFLHHFGHLAHQDMLDRIRAFTVAWGFDWQDGPPAPGVAVHEIFFLGAFATGIGPLDATKNWLDSARTNEALRAAA